MKKREDEQEIYHHRYGRLLPKGRKNFAES